MRHCKGLCLTACVLIAAGLVFYFRDDLKKLWGDFHVSIAKYSPAEKTVWLDQGLKVDDRSWYYHADQGTRTFSIPYEWFVALEQPSFSLLDAGLFHDAGYLDRYGFIADTSVPGKPAELPIGFAPGGPMQDSRGDPWRNPRTKADMTGVGLTCAACHTGRFTYHGTAVVIDGGPAITNLFELQKGLGVSLLLTRHWPGRFSRFADRVLGPDSTIDERAMLKDQIDAVLQRLGVQKSLEQAVAAASVEEGYSRLDALNRIGNQVFSLDLNEPKNYAPHTAPVHFPRIWNVPWFTWVQYNGSIMQPMVRNAGESLGVASELNLTEPSKGLFKSSVRVDELHGMERLIAGDPPATKFSGMLSPKWPEAILPKIDMNLAKQGAALYKTHCEGCHLPAIESDALAAEDKGRFFSDRSWWTVNDANQPLLDVKLIPIATVGTDPAQAEDMAKRTVALPTSLGIQDTGFGFALGDLVGLVTKYWYDQHGTSDDDRKRMDGYRPNKIQALMKYKARPLNGVWATPPYLHNGSVPTIDALLSPVSERPRKFGLGNREYDPEKLGYRTDSIENGSELDTSLRGNSNEGHEFSDKKGQGVIGPALKPDERKALIEFIKTL